MARFPGRLRGFRSSLLWRRQRPLHLALHLANGPAPLNSLPGEGALLRVIQGEEGPSVPHGEIAALEEASRLAAQAKQAKEVGDRRPLLTHGLRGLALGEGKGGHEALEGGGLL